MRQVTSSAFAEASITHLCKTIPSFRMIFEEGIVWQLKRRPLNEDPELKGREPKVFILQTSAHAPSGIPPLTIGYSLTEHGIEIVSVVAHIKTGPS